MRFFELILNCPKLNSPDAESIGSIIMKEKKEPTILLSGVNNQGMRLPQVWRWDYKK